MNETGDRDTALAMAGVRGRMAEACRRAGREPAGVTLVAVTKTVSVEKVAAARAAGIEHFGENYANDLASKSAAVAGTWHFIGTLQSGTARVVADHADVVQSAEPGRALERLGRRAAAAGRSLRCLAEIDFTEGRHGVRPDALASFLEHADELPGIDVVGLMTVPPQTPAPEGARPYFRRLRQLLEAHREGHPGLRELSMGMSADFEIAIEEGATMVRVGTALFGPRPDGDAEPGAPGAPGDAI